MALTAPARAHARKTLNKAEFELFSSTLDKRLSETNTYNLKRKVQRLKKLRSKYLTQKRGQKRLTKGKGLGVQETNRRAKLALIQDMLGRVENFLKQQLAQEKKQQGIKRSKKPNIKKTTARKALRKAKKATRETNIATTAKKAPKGLIKSQKLARAGIRRQQGHSSGRTKRQQGRRDGR